MTFHSGMTLLCAGMAVAGFATLIIGNYLEKGG